MEIPLLKLKKSCDFVETTEAFIKEHNLDGVVAVDETAGVSSINAATKSGLRIPEDLSVIGFTNGVLSQNSYPKMTTVSQHAQKIGKTTAKILIDKLELRAERYLPDTKVIKTSIVERGSTKSTKK